MRELTVLRDFDPFGGLPSPAASLATFDPSPPPADVVVVPGTYTALPFVADLRACTACTARSEARQVVLGQGPLDAVAMVLGQNPGVDEDREGVPFIGDSGEVLDQWLRVLGIDRQKLVVTNAVRCHTTGNRVPKASELKACFQWTTRELAALTKLQLLLPVGKPAITAVLGGSAPPLTPLSAHHYLVAAKGVQDCASFARQLHVFPLPHPAFLLRARHLGPLMHTVLTHVRRTIEQELPEAYALIKR